MDDPGQGAADLPADQLLESHAVGGGVGVEAAEDGGHHVVHGLRLRFDSCSFIWLARNVLHLLVGWVG
jgi:hypothetical protein